MENELGRVVPDLFVFKKKLYMRKKQVVSTLVLMYLCSPRFRQTTKTNCTKFQNIDPEICSILIILKKA